MHKVNYEAEKRQIMKRSFYRFAAISILTLLLLTDLTVPVFAMDAEPDRILSETSSRPEPEPDGDTFNEGIPQEYALNGDVSETVKYEDISEDQSDDDLLSDEQDEADREYPTGYNYIPGEGDVESIADFGDDEDDADSLMGSDFSEEPPSSYTTPNLPPLRNQNPHGTCWAHSVMAAAEISMIRQGFMTSPDFSELHLAYFQFNTPADPTGRMNGDNNAGVYTEKEPNYLERGGNHEYASKILASWIGAADESAAPYGSASEVLETGLPDGIAYSDAAHLKNYYKVSTKTAEDRKAIKRMVMDLGAAGVAFNVMTNKPVYYNEAGNCYYYPYTTAETNHVVTIVGWDDDFSRTKFSKAPEGDGAWLVRNSWYDERYDDTESLSGYFWMSYYDKSILNSPAWGYEYESNRNYDHNYQYDGACYTFYPAYSYDFVSEANVFTVSEDASNEVLEAVSIYSENTNTDYDIKIYKNPSDETNPSSGTLMTELTGKTTYAGYYTLPLSEEVSLSPGDKFSVVVTRSKTGAELEPSTEYSYRQFWFESTAASLPGQSFVKLNQKWTYDNGSYEYRLTDWIDTSTVTNVGNVRIKAFTSDDDTERYTVTLNANGGGFGPGVTEKTKTVRAGRTYGVLAEPEREGYDFAGWYTDETDGERVDPSGTVTGEIILYAHWSGKEYTLTLDPRGGAFAEGSSAGTVTVRFGEKYGELPKPEKAGHDFTGWFTSGQDGTLITKDTLVSPGNLNISEDTHTLLAGWVPSEYTVTFDAMGGNCDTQSKRVTYGSVFGDLPTPYKDYCDPLGWYTERTGGVKIESTTAVNITEDITLYARWRGAGVQVTLDPQGGTCKTSSMTVHYSEPYGGSSLSLPEASRNGYDFEGWFTDDEGGNRILPDSFVNNVSAHTLYAHWSAKTYTVSFSANNGKFDNGKITDSREVTFGHPYGELPVPSRDGYDFDGYSKTSHGNDRIEEDSLLDYPGNLVLYAQWKPKTYTVLFNPNGGNCETESQTVTYKAYYGELPAAVKDNYDFEGWYTGVTGGIRITPKTVMDHIGDITLYAHYSGAAVTVSFNAAGGYCSIPSKTVYYDGTYGGYSSSLPTAIRNGYTFDGWHTSISGGDPVLADTMVERTDPHTLYAHWKPNTYVLTLHANEGTFTNGNPTDTMNVTFGSPYGDLKVPKRAGYDLVGYFTEKTGGVPVTKDTIVSEDNFNVNKTPHYVYARWTPTVFRVTLDPCGGTCAVSSLRAVYKSNYPEFPVASRPGYEFRGWYTAEKGGTLVTSSTQVTRATDHTLYARWEANSYTVLFDIGGGRVSPYNRAVTFGNAYGNLPLPAKEGYDFDGWYTEETGGVLVTEDTIVSVENFDVNSETHYLHAHWSPKTCIVTLDANGGECGTESFEATYGLNYPEMETPVKTGYDFTGWYSQKAAGNKITEQSEVKRVTDHTLYAHWSPKRLRITYYPVGGESGVSGKTVVYDNKYGELVTPSRTGYVFDGWYMGLTGGLRITEDMTVTDANIDPEASVHPLYARWHADSYFVTFDAGKGSCGVKLKSVTYDEPYGELPTPEAPENYDFTGWYTKPLLTSEKIEEDTVVKTGENHILYAVYRGKPHEVTFDVNGGNELNEADRVKTVYYNDVYGELPVPLREGYDFAGWYPSADAPETARITEESAERISVAHRLFAHWKIKTFTVTFAGNGGFWDAGEKEDLTRSVIMEWDSTLSEETLSQMQAPIRGGYRFTGWFEDAEGNNPYPPDRGLRSDLTVHAGWQQVPDGFSVKAVDENGELKDLDQVSYVFTGSPVNPRIVVFDNKVTPDRPLIEKTDYTVTYRNNTNVYKGDANKAPVISITGKGNYQKDRNEAFEFEFTIDPLALGNGSEFSDGFSCTIPDKQYKGRPQLSKPVIKYGKLTLKENTDYTLRYFYEDEPLGEDESIEPVRPGKVVVSVTGLGNYTGKAEASYDIFLKDTGISTAYVQKISDVTYTGEEPDLNDILIVVKEKSTLKEALVRGSEDGQGGDYYVRYAAGTNRKDVGTVTIEIVGKGRFVGKKTAAFKIVPKKLTPESITSGELEINVAEAYYTGAAVKPAVTVSHRVSGVMVPLVEDKDYTVAYSNNIKASPGNAQKNAPAVTIKGKGNFTGSAGPVPFTIKPLELSQYDVDIYIPDMKDTGTGAALSALRPSVTLFDPHSGKKLTLVKGTDYDMEFKKGQDASEQVRIVYFTFRGNYANVPDLPETPEDEGKVEGSFILYRGQKMLVYDPQKKKESDLSDDDFMILADDKDLTYTGSPLKPEITVKYMIDGQVRTLLEGKDYSLTCSNNTNAASKDAGKKAPSWKIAGKGAYKGTASGTFTIKPAVLSDRDYSLNIADMKWTGKTLKPSVKVIDNDTGKVISAANYSLYYDESRTLTPTGDDRIEVRITRKGTGGEGNYSGTLTGSFRVYEKMISTAVFDRIEFEYYTGRPLRPSGNKVKIWADKSLSPSSRLKEFDGTGGDYKLSYGTNTKIGRGSVTVEGLGTYGGTKTLYFSILPRWMKR